MGVTASSVHKALQKKANREVTEQFVREMEAKVSRDADSHRRGWYLQTEEKRRKRTGD